MDVQTIDRIFEPFFTTKRMGEGTGLGLATVHGIVKQSRGHIMVYSEPEHGSTFKVYLPAVAQNATYATPREEADQPHGGTETVLLCEDDDAVRRMANEMLAAAGYTVLVARNGTQAREVARAHGRPLDLLVTDVIMPDTNGRALADQLQAAQPDLEVLFISGYTSNVIAHHGVLDQGVSFLQKPFNRRELLQHVRDILDRSPARRAAPTSSHPAGGTDS
jgi:CheY-like chemotaxis protein